MTSSSKSKHDVQSMQGTVLDANKIFKNIFFSTMQYKEV